MQNYKKILSSISIITIAYASSRLLGFFREILLANWAGVSGETDVLDLAFIIPDFLFYLSAGGYLAITLIPLLGKKDSEDVNNYFLSLLYGLSTVFVVLSSIGYLFKNQIAEILNVQNQTLFIEIFGLIIFSQVFFFIGAILMSYQYFKEEFKYAALAPIVYNATIILFGWLNSSDPTSTIKGFALGTLIGSVLGHLVIQIFGAKKSGLEFKILRFKLSDVKNYIVISFPLILGQSIAVMDEQLFRYFGSFLSVGSIATFRYARRVAFLPVGIIAQAVGVASYPFLSKLFQKNKIDELDLLVKKQIAYLYLISGGIVIICFFSSEFIIQMIYERGAFTNSDTLQVSRVFQIISLGIIPWSINQIATRSFYVQQQFWFPVITGTVITLVLFFILLNIDTDGILYTKIIVASLYVYLSILLLNLKFENLKFVNKDFSKDLAKITLLLVSTFTLFNFFSFESNFLSVSTVSLSTVLILFVSLNLLKFKYIKIGKNK